MEDMKITLYNKSDNKHSDDEVKCITLVKRETFDKELYDAVYEKCPELADYAVKLGGSGVVFYAKEGETHYLVKRIIKPSQNDCTEAIMQKLDKYYSKDNCNYCLKLRFVGVDERENKYLLFDKVNGDTPKPQSPKTIREILTVLKEFKGLVRCLGILHQREMDDICYLHGDIKPDNIFRYKLSHDESTFSMQLIDFDSSKSAISLQDDIAKRGVVGYNFSNTEGWYDTSYSIIDELCKKIKIDYSYARIADLTATVRVLKYLICGDKPGFQFEDFPIQYEGTFRNLHRIWKKANNSNIDMRYKSCDELILDIDALIESCEGNITKPEAIPLVSMNTCENTGSKIMCLDRNTVDWKIKCSEKYPGKTWKDIDFLQLRNNIKPNLLAEIYVSNKEKYGYESNFNPILALFEKYKAKSNIILRAMGGAGKSTAIEYLCVDCCLNLYENAVFVKLSGADFKEREVKYYGEDKITNILQKRYVNCSLDNFLLNYNPKDKKMKTTVCILLDGADDIPKEYVRSVFREVNKLNRHGIRFIITSRYDSEIIKYTELQFPKTLYPSKTTKALLLPKTSKIYNKKSRVLKTPRYPFIKCYMDLLSEKQVEEELGGPISNSKIAKLIRRPMLLLIYKEIREKISKSKTSKNKDANALTEAYLTKIQKDLNDTEEVNALIEAYLIKTQEDLGKDKYDTRYFINRLLSYCERDIHGSELEEVSSFLKSNRVEHIFLLRLANTSNTDKDGNAKKVYRIFYIHNLYKEYIEYKIQTKNASQPNE